MFKIPPLSADLIREMRADNPVRGQGQLHLMTPAELAHYAGQQSVIESLERMLEESAEYPSVLEGPNVF
jgi:hypothetical protein